MRNWPASAVMSARPIASPGRGRGVVAVLARGVCIALLLATIALPHAAVAGDAKAANFFGEAAADSVRQVADRVVSSNNNRSRPFLIIDKANAKVFLFSDQGQLRGATGVLLGLARGDDAVAGIGNRKISSIKPAERITPAGRFTASMGHDIGGRTILWVDYANSIALHRVITSNPQERRLERLASASPSERRISYGCINVPVEFFEKFVIPAFTGTQGIVYIIPETRPVAESLFGGST